MICSNRCISLYSYAIIILLIRKNRENGSFIPKRKGVSSMTRSMTGFGRAQEITDGVSIQVELRSVNHRYLEINTRVPRPYSFLEEKIKSYLKSRLARGKVDCSVSLEFLEDQGSEVVVNRPLAEAYLKTLRNMEDEYHLTEGTGGITALDLAGFPDVLQVNKVETDEEALWNSVKQVLETATDRFIEMRETEGKKMEEDIQEKAETILDSVKIIEKRSPELVEEYNERLKKRIKDLAGDAACDEQRILAEAAVYADKVAVDEETVRLKSHLNQLKDMFDEDGSIGRKMDFLVQEINRETNTIGSKVSDLDVTSMVLDMKGNIEKIREQVQNIE